MLKDLARRARSVRRFRESRRLSLGFLHELVDLARLGASARNAQVLKYMCITEEELCAQIFPLLAWAGYLPDWPGPEQGERPAAYIICFLDRALLGGPDAEAWVDLGIATQNMVLGAAERGVLGCRIGAFSGEKLARVLRLEGQTGQLEALEVLAWGYPAETVVLEKMAADGNVRYWNDAQGLHHVPKRELEEILLIAPRSSGVAE